MDTNEQGSKGTMIGSIIVVIIIIIGAIYFFYNQASAPTDPNGQTPTGDQSTLDANQPTPSADDDLAAIESDLNVVSQDPTPEINAIEQGLGE